MVNCAECGKPIGDKVYGIKVEKHALVETRNFMFHVVSQVKGVESCADTFETRQMIMLGEIKLIPTPKKGDK